MSVLHKLILYGSLAFLGISLVIPGLIEMYILQPGSPGLLAETTDAKNQLRALNGMMTGVGFLALWACINLQHSRTLILSLGGILLLVVLARGYAMIVDGLPTLMTWGYFALELMFSLLFLLWPPTE